MRLDLKTKEDKLSIFEIEIKGQHRIGIYVYDDYEGDNAVFYATKEQLIKINKIINKIIENKNQ